MEFFVSRTLIVLSMCHLCYYVRNLLLLCWLVPALSSPLFAKGGVEVSAVRCGISGQARAGHWAEVQLTLRSPYAITAEVEVLTRDGDGVPVAFVAANKVQLAAGATQSISIPVKMGPPRSGLIVRVLAGDELLAEHKLTETALVKLHRSTTDLIGIFGEEEVGLTQAIDWLGQSHTDDIESFAIPLADEMPNDFRGYQALERLCVVVGKVNPLDQLSPTQKAALLQWVRLGGRLQLAFCASSENGFAANSPWRELLPGELGAEEPLLSEAGIKSFTSEPLPFDLNRAEHKPQVRLLSAPRQQVVQLESGAATNDRPLVIDSPLGFGRVTCVMLDLSHPQLADWQGRSRFWSRVLYSKALVQNETESAGGGGRVTHRGYRDLAGQLRSALDQYEQVTPIHFYGVAGALLIYLLLLGPGEYFLLQRFSRNYMQLTWLLLPVLVGGMVAGGVWLGRTSHGTQERVNHLELLDLDATTGQQRGLFWSGIFTPVSRDFSLTATPKLNTLAGSDLQRTEISWQALPGDGLGGVDTPPLANLMPNRYRIQAWEETQATLIDLPVAAASSKLLTGSWWGEFTPGKTVSQLKKGKIKDLEGSFQNLSPVPLKQAFLAHGEWIYRASDDLAPGATVNLERLERKHLENQLTQRLRASNDLATPWNADDADIPRILEIMMFHDAVGSESYTVLSNRYQHELDLSRLLKQGYAVLVGRIAAPLVELKEDGAPLAPETTRRWSYLRIIYPVLQRTDEVR